MPEWCAPRGLLNLYTAARTRTAILSDWVKALIRGIEQFDFSIFDMEVCHRKVRDAIESGDGQTSDLSNVSLQFFGNQVNFYHGHAAVTRRAVGRPKQPEQKQRKRYDGWNAFVSVHRPAVGRRDMGRFIKSGSHLA